MSLWSRIKALFRANAHSALDKAEDPAKMADEWLRQLTAQYEEAKRGTAAALASAQRLAQKRDAHRKEAEAWEQRAINALSRNDEDLARTALERKQHYARIASEFAIQAESQEAQVKDLRAALTRVEQQIFDARAKRDLIKSKSNLTRSKEAMGQTLRKGAAAQDLGAKLDALEERVDDRLNLAQAHADLEARSLDARLTNLETTTSVDAELALLKQKLNS